LSSVHDLTPIILRVQACPILLGGITLAPAATVAAVEASKDVNQRRRSRPIVNLCKSASKCGARTRGVDERAINQAQERRAAQHAVSRLGCTRGKLSTAELEIEYIKLRRLISNSTKESRGLPACRHCMVIALIAPRNSGNSLRRIGVPLFTSLPGFFINRPERISEYKATHPSDIRSGGLGYSGDVGSVDSSRRTVADLRNAGKQTSLINIFWLLVVQAHGHYQLTRQICRAGDPDRKFRPLLEILDAANLRRSSFIRCTHQSRRVLNPELVLILQVDYSIDSMRIVNNKAEKSCSSIAEAREADETIRKVWHAFRLMETGYDARTPRGQHPTNTAHVSLVAQTSATPSPRLSTSACLHPTYLLSTSDPHLPPPLSLPPSLPLLPPISLSGYLVGNAATQSIEKDCACIFGSVAYGSAKVPPASSPSAIEDVFTCARAHICDASDQKSSRFPAKVILAVIQSCMVGRNDSIGSLEKHLVVMCLILFRLFCRIALFWKPPYRTYYVSVCAFVESAI
ncbi:hypothetical protein KCU95_g73, partial [Aureobasidium melanogenum]